MVAGGPGGLRAVGGGAGGGCGGGHEDAAPTHTSTHTTLTPIRGTCLWGPGLRNQDRGGEAAAALVCTMPPATDRRVWVVTGSGTPCAQRRLVLPRSGAGGSSLHTARGRTGGARVRAPRSNGKLADAYPPCVRCSGGRQWRSLCCSYLRHRDTPATCSGCCQGRAGGGWMQRRSGAAHRRWVLAAAVHVYDMCMIHAHGIAPLTGDVTTPP